jgi:hypothetical protein
VVLIGFGAASAIAIQGIEQNDTPWTGAFERVNAYALMAWYLALAVMVTRRQLKPQNRREETGGDPRQGTDAGLKRAGQDSNLRPED